MYDVIKSGRGQYTVLEVDTNLILTKCKNLWDAEKFVNNQRNGSGFQGRTPTFMALGQGDTQ